MRKQTRPPEPQELKDHSEKWTQQWIIRRQEKPSATFEWYEHGKKDARKWILPALRIMNQEHCSFCDGYPIAGVSLETVEHFRPKTDPRFLHLAYSWENLYYCCNACQQKGPAWPDDGLPEPIAPDEPGYDFRRFFRFDVTTGAIEVADTASPHDAARASLTIELYRLDSGDRRRWRRKARRDFAEGMDLDDEPYRDYIGWGRE